MDILVRVRLHSNFGVKSRFVKSRKIETKTIFSLGLRGSFRRVSAIGVC